MNRTKVEWCKNPDGTQGYTWNPITGCLNGCDYCYARRLANTRLRKRYLANINTAPLDNPNSFTDAKRAILDDPFYPRLWPERMGRSLIRPRSRTPLGVFVCDMSDLFGIGIPERWQQEVFDVIRMFPAYRFYLLTKQPQNLLKWSPFPENCWVGVTVTNDAMMEAAARALDDIWAAVSFISFEPLLSSLSKGSLTLIEDYICHWAIIGAQTKPTVFPKIEHVQEIVEAADQAGIPVFLKDNLWPLLTPVFEKAGCIDNFFTESCGLRQELPQEAK